MKLFQLALLLILTGPAWAIEVEERYLSLGDSHIVFDGNLGPKEIAISFGGAIDPNVTRQILNILTDNKLRAHFFVPGLSAVQNPALIVKMLSAGHVLGSNGYGKSLVTSEDKTFEARSAKIEKEITLGHEMVYSVAGMVYPFIRFSARHGTLEARRFIRDNSVYAFYWNMDFEPKDSEHSLAESLKREDSRGIVTLGLGMPKSVAVLKRLVQEINDQGLKVIVFMPPKDSELIEKAPLVRQMIKKIIEENGPLANPRRQGQET